MAKMLRGRYTKSGFRKKVWSLEPHSRLGPIVKRKIRYAKSGRRYVLYKGKKRYI